LAFIYIADELDMVRIVSWKVQKVNLIVDIRATFWN